jgi:hypothetical protein
LKKKIPAPTGEFPLFRFGEGDEPGEVSLSLRLTLTRRVGKGPEEAEKRPPGGPTLRFVRGQREGVEAREVDVDAHSALVVDQVAADLHNPGPVADENVHLQERHSILGLQLALKVLPHRTSDQAANRCQRMSTTTATPPSENFRVCLRADGERK